MAQCVATAEESRPSCTAAASCAAPHGLCRLAITRFGAAQRIHELARGERLHVSARVGPVLRTVRSGLAAICASLPDGRRQIVFLATPGDPLLPCEQLASSCWVEALAPTTVCELDLSASKDAFTRDSAMLDALLDAAHDGLAIAAARVITLGRTDGTERVTGFLADMTRRLGQPSDGGWRVQLPLSREDIADYLGLNAETVSRILGRIKRARLAVFLSPTEIEVPDLDRLAARSPLHTGPRMRVALETGGRP